MYVVVCKTNHRHCARCQVTSAFTWAVWASCGSQGIGKTQSLKVPIHEAVFFFLISPNWTDSPIYLNEVDEGILLTVLFYSDSWQWSVLQAIGCTTEQTKSFQHARSWEIDHEIDFSQTRTAIEVSTFGQCLQNGQNVSPSMASFKLELP